MPRSPSVPSYRLHKPSGQAVVTIRTVGGTRRDVYLGVHNSPESRAEYGRLIAELATAPAAALQVGPSAPRVTVDEVLLAFLTHSERHYRDPDGNPSDEVREIKRSVLHVHNLYGHTAARDFGPRALDTVRRAMVGADWCRTLVNRRVERVKRAFRWAASQELVPVGVYEALRTLPGLQRGRTEARESEPVTPVDPAHVAATLPFLGTHVRAMVELQLLTGARPGEVCRLTLGQVERVGDVWTYRPRRHKSAHRGKKRAIPFGPKARAAVVAFLLRDGPPPVGFSITDDTSRLVMADAYQEAGRERDAVLLRDLTRPVVLISGCVADPDAPLFSPAASRAEWAKALRAKRKSKVPPSQKHRRKSKPKKVPGAVYTVAAYGYAVRKAAQKAKVANWHPNMLRHAFATAVRRVLGLEAAGAALGHAKMSATEVYAERDLALAAKVASELG